jgi:3-dehydroquinate dehydratase-2
MKVLVINGPNLNLLGKREPEIYGKFTYQDLVEFTKDAAKSIDLDVEVFQSNSEAEIVEKVQAASNFDGIIINAGAYTHTSIAIRDALLSVGIPIVEVHLSNIFAREDFRKKSYISDIAVGVISGFGREGYRFALYAIKEILEGPR